MPPYMMQFPGYPQMPQMMGYPQMPQMPQMPQVPQGYPQMPQAPATPAKATTVEVPITGAIVRFANGAPRIGDCKLEIEPQGINYTIASGLNGDYLRTATQWKGTAHVGAHGRVWVDGLTDTGIPAPVASNTADQAIQFETIMAKVKGVAPVASDNEPAV